MARVEQICSTNSRNVSKPCLLPILEHGSTLLLRGSLSHCTHWKLSFWVSIFWKWGVEGGNWLLFLNPLKLHLCHQNGFFLKQDVGLMAKQLLHNERKQKLIRDLSKERLLVLHTQSKSAGFTRAHFDLSQTNYRSVAWLFCALVALPTEPKLPWYTAVIRMKIWRSVNKAWQGSFSRHNDCIIQF